MRHILALALLCSVTLQAANPKGFGGVSVVAADGGTATNLTSISTRTSGSGLQALLTAGAGGTVQLPPHDFSVTETINIPTNTIVIAYGTRIYNTADEATILTMGTGSRLYGAEVYGTGNASANTNGIGIKIYGATDEYKEDIVIADCHIHDISFYGILVEFGERITIRNSRIEDIAYAAIMVLSGTDVTVDGNHIYNLSPGSSGNAYGLAFTRRTTGTLSDFPRSQNCRAINNTVDGNGIWEALDTHAGEDILFQGNMVKNSKMGILAVSDASGNAPLNIRIIGNHVDGTGTSGYGIGLAGADDVLGTPLEYATGLIEGNTIIHGGYTNNANSGAIYLVATKGAVVSANRIEYPRVNGIVLYYDNQNAVLTGNLIKDPWDNTLTVPAAVALRSEYNTATIVGNEFLRDDTTVGTNVAVRGVNVATTNNNATVIGFNKNNFTTPYFGFQPAIYSTGSDSTLTGIKVDPTTGEVAIGGSSLNYKLNVRGSESGHNNLILAQNTTSAGYALMQVAALGGIQAGFRAYSTNYATARFAGRAGLIVESPVTALLLAAEGATQTIDLAAGSGTVSARLTNGVWQVNTAQSGTSTVSTNLTVTNSGQFDKDATAGNTRFLIYDVDNGTLERVTVGAADSGGSGYKVLRIPN